MDDQLKKDSICNIEGLYPIDSQYEKTNKIGMKLLLMAILDNDWRNLPSDILERYSDLCIELENHEPGAGVVWNRVNNFSLD